MALRSGCQWVIDGGALSVCRWLCGADNRYIEDARDGFASRIEWIVGPSRVGKTMLINALAREHRGQNVDGKRRVPVLVVSVLPNISPVLLPSSVLSALGVPLQQKGLTSGMMFKRMLDQLKLAATRVFLFEEASHLVEPGARVPPRAAGDWFKAAADALNMTIMLFGVPRLAKLFEGNEPLRMRASARREFRPYDFRSPSDQKAFASCVRTYADLFSESGWPIEIPLKMLVIQCYLLTGGLVGVLSKFMPELASQMRYEAPRPLTIEDCRFAAGAIQAAGHPDFPAFAKTEVSPIELTTAHALCARDQRHVDESRRDPISRHPMSLLRTFSPFDDESGFGYYRRLAAGNALWGWRELAGIANVTRSRSALLGHPDHIAAELGLDESWAHFASRQEQQCRSWRGLRRSQSDAVRPAFPTAEIERIQQRRGERVNDEPACEVGKGSSIGSQSYGPRWGHRRRRELEA
ncbi:ATP-binding protein [Paraburkholderia sp. RL17-337-BIB-A]|uniref:ATP-binding protein n=1 Tax=Paraburkholderia sp. RL17-337-BIB-A TaxID=3031636 RepID=UPI0038BAF272